MNIDLDSFDCCMDSKRHLYIGGDIQNTCIVPRMTYQPSLYLLSSQNEMLENNRDRSRYDLNGGILYSQILTIIVQSGTGKTKDILDIVSAAFNIDGVSQEPLNDMIIYNITVW